MASDTAKTTGRREIIVLQLLVLLFLAIRAYFDLKADLFGDEAYYWMWGQRLGWSYFDHPPLHAWLLRLVAITAGWHPISVRLLSWLTLAGVLLIFRSWAARMAPEAPRLWFWRTAAIYIASPIFFGMTMIAYNDHLLVLLSLLAIHCFVVFIDRVETGEARALRWLYGAAIALGLAVLTKYNGVFIGFGFVATCLLRPKLRRLLATPHPWLTGLLAAAMQAPVIYWNFAANLASFRYHLDDRWGGAVGHFSWLHPVNFILLCIILWSPFLVWPLIRMLRSTPATDFEGRARTVAVSIFAISSLSFLAISCVLDAFFYWNIVAFIGLMPLLTRFMGNPVLRWAHYLFGLLFAVLIVVNFSVIPVGELLGIRDRGSSSDYNWTAIGEHMRAAEEKTPADLIAATRYSTTAQLGFALGTPDTVKLSPEHSQYDYWQDEADYAGKSALILTDEQDGDGTFTWLRQHFASLTQIDSIDTMMLGPHALHLAHLPRRRVQAVTPAQPAPAWATPLGAALVVLLLMLPRAIFAARFGLIGDEAYYAIWSFFPSFGYFDHSPSVAWVIWLGRSLFGESQFAVRSMFLIADLIVCAALYRLGDLLFADRRIGAAAAIAYSVTVGVLITFSVATPDGPSTLFWVLTLWAVAEFARGRNANWWLLAGAFAGLGLLSKYTVVFLGAGLLFYLLTSRERLQWLKLWQVWAGGALALLLFRAGRLDQFAARLELVPLPARPLEFFRRRDASRRVPALPHRGGHPVPADALRLRHHRRRAVLHAPRPGAGPAGADLGADGRLLPRRCAVRPGQSELDRAAVPVLALVGAYAAVTVRPRNWLRWPLDILYVLHVPLGLALMLFAYQAVDTRSIPLSAR